MRIFLLLLCCFWFSVVLAEDEEQLPVELRLRKLENTIETINPLELYKLIDNLNKRINELQGEVDLLQHQIEQQQTSINTLESNQGLLITQTQSLTSDRTESTGNVIVNTEPSITEESPDQNPIPESVIIEDSPEEDPEARNQYQAAFQLLKESRYQDATNAFTQFLQNYSRGEYADKAQYWIGEIHYIQQDFSSAITAYQTHLENFPQSPKRSQSKLKLANSYIETNQLERANQTLEQILDEFPGSSAARAATETLRDLSLTNTPSE